MRSTGMGTRGTVVGQRGGSSIFAILTGRKSILEGAKGLNYRDIGKRDLILTILTHPLARKFVSHVLPRDPPAISAILAISDSGGQPEGQIPERGTAARGA